MSMAVRLSSKEYKAEEEGNEDNTNILSSFLQEIRTF